MIVKTPLKKNPVQNKRRKVSGGLSTTAKKTAKKSSVSKVSKGKPPKGKKRKISLDGFNTDGSAPNLGRRLKTKQDQKNRITSLPAFTPWKVILASFLIGVCGILYISHVFSTQQILQEVQQLENEFNRAKRLHDEKQLAFDRLVGPKEIYQKARQQGFINAGPADQVIEIKP